MKEFNSWLNKQYGQGNYLTSSKIDWDNCGAITPEKSGKYSMNSVLAGDAIVCHEACLKGSGSISLGVMDLPKRIIPADYDGAFLFGAVIKKAGEDTHHIPKELMALAPVFQTFANYQYDISEYAHDKVAVISFRSLTLNALKPQIGNVWHLHDNFQDTDELGERLRFFGNTKDHIWALRDVSPNMVHSEAYISNECPTLIQTEPCENELLIHSTSNSHTLGAANQTLIPHRSLLVNELAVGDSYTWHKSQDLSEDDHGKNRFLLVINYCPMRQMERHFS